MKTWFCYSFVIFYLSSFSNSVLADNFEDNVKTAFSYDAKGDVRKRYIDNRERIELFCRKSMAMSFHVIDGYEGDEYAVELTGKSPFDFSLGERRYLGAALYLGSAKIRPSHETRKKWNSNTKLIKPVTLTYNSNNDEFGFSVLGLTFGEKSGVIDYGVHKIHITIYQPPGKGEVQDIEV